MEWNAKSLGQWDWENFFFMNGRATENPKLQLSTDWLGEADREVNIGALYPSGGSRCSASELFHASSSRSSKSASNNSSSNGDSKLSMLTQEGSQDGSTTKKELPVETSPTTEPSAVSGEPLLTLKLGKRFYFEDVSNGSGSKKLTSSEVLLSSGKKGKSGQNLIPASCQVEGCGLDLSSAKDYHRKHRVCETHSKSPMVVIAGLERRFCQQCSRFHALPEFDNQKRSCRRRLADHNARRRKPQPEAVQLNPSALPSSPYGTNLTSGRQIMGPHAFPRNATNIAWHEHDIHSSSKLPQTKDFLLKPTKNFHKIPNTMLSDDSSGLLASKGIGTKTTFPGIQDPNDTQDVNRALSLLSTNSWDAYETKALSLQHSDRTNCITQTRTHTNTQRLPLPSSEYWHTDHQPADSSTCVSYSDYDNSNRFQDFQLLNAPFESSFPCNQLD